MLSFTSLSDFLLDFGFWAEIAKSELGIIYEQITLNLIEGVLFPVMTLGILQHMSSTNSQLAIGSAY